MFTYRLTEQVLAVKPGDQLVFPNLGRLEFTFSPGYLFGEGRPVGQTLKLNAPFEARPPRDHRDLRRHEIRSIRTAKVSLFYGPQE